MSDIADENKKYYTWKRLDPTTPYFDEKRSPRKKKYDEFDPKDRQNFTVPSLPMDIVKGYSKEQRTTFTEGRRRMTPGEKMRHNPLVPIGLAVTTVSFAMMLYSSMKGKPRQTAFYMKSRIAAQVFTLVMMMGTMYYATEHSDSILPMKPDEMNNK